MFQLVGLGEQAGSGFPKIYKNWKEQHWKSPKLEERFDSNQTILVLGMTSLLPDEIIAYLKSIFGKRFDELNQLERIALVTARAERCVTHRRLIELSKEHPSELTKTLHGLVDKQFLKSDGIGKGTFYYLIGEHPIKGDIIPEPERLETSSEHLKNNSEQLDNKYSEHLQQIARPIQMSKKCSKNLVAQAIIDLCQTKPLSLFEIAQLLNRKEDSIRNHYINNMCDEGVLNRQYPNIIKHPKQKYYVKNTASS